MNCIFVQGGGGCLTQEKVVAANSKVREIGNKYRYKMTNNFKK